MATWVKDDGLKKGVLETTNYNLLSACSNYMVLDRHLDLTLTKSSGMLETQAMVEVYREAFERMRAAKMIP